MHFNLLRGACQLLAPPLAALHTFRLSWLMMCFTFCRWFCSSFPCQPVPSEPASSPHTQPDACQPDAPWLRWHGRASAPLLRSACLHGPPGRDGPHGSRRARNGRRGSDRDEHRDECRDPSLHVHAPATDEHAPPGGDTACWNH